MTNLADLWYGTSGPRNASVAIVGESWGREEEAERRPFVGQSGQELRRMVAEAGLRWDDCFVTNVVSARPAGNEMWRFFEPKDCGLVPLRGLHPTTFVTVSLQTLHEQLAAVKPKVIIAAGNYALWALTTRTKFSIPHATEGRRVPSGIESWRGSMWYAEVLPDAPMLVPIIHPAAIMREWYKRAITVHDIRRVHQALAQDWRPPISPTVLAPPTFEEAMNVLEGWTRSADAAPLRLVNDIETARGLMTCIGFADSPSFAMTIPFVRLEGKGFESYWNEEQENVLARAIRKVLHHRNVLVEGQNYLYDTQYIQAFLACSPVLDFDTMLAHHLLFPGTPKGLDYLSSLYCHYHWFWKDDSKEWDLREDLNSLLSYNSLDCLRQFECGTALRSLIESEGLSDLWEERKQFNILALDMMNRGVRVDRSKRALLAIELLAVLDDLGNWLLNIVPQTDVQAEAKTPWFRSDKQIKKFFTEDLGLRLPSHRKTGQPTFGKDAIKILSDKHPEFIRIFSAIETFRSIRTFRSNFIEAPLDHDGRIRCMFNTAGTETFRWSSSENAFGRGTNLQNIPKGDEE